MRMLSRYIGSTIIKFNLLVLLVVLGMEFFILLVAEFDDIGHGNYHLTQALYYVLMSLPANLYSLFPMIGLLGSLIGLGLLGSNNELVVMRTAGVSVARIILSVLKAALILIIFITIIGEYVAPICQHLGNTEKVLAESSGQATESAGGVWLKSQNAFINIQHIVPDMRLEGITEYQFNDQHVLLYALSAKEAFKKHREWYLHNAQTSYFSAQGVTSQVQDIVPWNVKIDSRLLGVTRDNANEMNLWQLGHYLAFRQKNGLASGLFGLNFWQRLIQPLSSLVMIFLAVPFVFGPLRSVTMGVRIVTGAVFGFAFYLLNEFFGPFSLVYQIPAFLGAIVPTILFAILAWYLMRRVK